MHAAIVLALAAAIAEPTNDYIKYDNRSLVLNGTRTMILSGGLHYARIMPEDWDSTIKLAKAMGLNTIQTYTMWNFHEEKKDEWNFEYRRDLRKFVQTIGDNGMYSVVRIGPYVCGEYSFGGVPVWMRDEADCFRCSDPGWEAHMKNAVTIFTDKIKDLLYPNGPVIMLQVENEYPASKPQPYLNWAVEMARNITTQVPWNLCHDLPHCSAVSHAAGNYEVKALCTINGFWMDEYTTDPNQPSPKWMQDNLEMMPGTPLMWTEDQAWFDQWGLARRVRVSSDLLYGITRFIAYGGSYHNFYMLSGGNNYGLQAGGTAATAYAADAAINNLLMRHEPRYGCYTKFFNLITSITPELLSHPIPPAVQLVTFEEVEAATTTVVLVPCTDTDPSHPGVLDASQKWTLRSNGTVSADILPSSCIALGANNTIVVEDCSSASPSTQFNLTADGNLKSVAKPSLCLEVASSSSATLSFATCASTPSQDWSHTSEQGLIAASQKDLCLTLQQQASGCESHTYGSISFLANTGPTPQTVTFQGKTFTLFNSSVTIVNGTDVIYTTASCADAVVIPGTLPTNTTVSTPKWKTFTEGLGYGFHAYSTPTAPVEQLSLTENIGTDYMWYCAEFTNATSNSTAVATMMSGSIGYVYLNSQQACVYSCAMGMQTNNVGPSVKKGLEALHVDGINVTGPWTMQWLNSGEHNQIFTEAGSSAVKWVDWVQGTSQPAALTWYQAEFLNVGNATQYALELSPMWKGTAYVNGFNIGRYWLKPGKCSSDCAMAKSGHCYLFWNKCGEPTQTVYHIPSSVVNTTGPNLVTLYEETVTTETVLNPLGVKFISYFEPSV